MRTMSWLAAFALLTVALAFAPGASAGNCASTHNVEACTSGVTITNDWTACVWGGHWEETTVGPVTYREWVCDQGPSDPR